MQIYMGVAHKEGAARWVWGLACRDAKPFSLQNFLKSPKTLNTSIVQVS